MKLVELNAGEPESVCSGVDNFFFFFFFGATSLLCVQLHTAAFPGHSALLDIYEQTSTELLIMLLVIESTVRLHAMCRNTE